MLSIEMHYNSVTLHEVCGSGCPYTNCPQTIVHLSVVFFLVQLTAACVSEQLPVFLVSSCTAAVSRPEHNSAFPRSSQELLTTQRPFL